MVSIRHSSKLVVLALVIISAFACQSKKKAMQAQAAEKARIEREAEEKRKADELAKKEAEEKAKWEAEQQKKAEEKIYASAPAVKVEEYFSAIAKANNTTAANTSINEALTLFASPNTPVLIVISESGGTKDYDRPTTIKEYLNYLKDQKKNINAVADLKTDGAGKITELELRKN